MCVSKVANCREQMTGENRGGGTDGGIYGGGDEENSVLESLVSPMLSGFDRQQENSAIVSALAHVVAGEADEELEFMNQGDGGVGSVGGGGCAASNGESSSPSACSSRGIGEKRGRQELHDLGLSESVPVVCRAYSDLPLVGSTLGSGMSFNIRVQPKPLPPPLHKLLSHFASSGEEGPESIV